MPGLKRGTVKLYEHEKNKKKPAGKSGFTLVELIVVIVIILVLAVVLIPKYYAKTGNDLSLTDEFIYKLLVSDMELTRWDTKDWIMINNIKRKILGFGKGVLRVLVKKKAESYYYL